MPNETTTFCLRVSIEERNLFVAVGHHANMTPSAWARNILNAAAQKVLLTAGPEAVMQADRDFEARQADKARRKLQARIAGVAGLQQAATTTEVESRDPDQR